jgi:hypothetical protein
VSSLDWSPAKQLQPNDCLRCKADIQPLKLNVRYWPIFTVADHTNHRYSGHGEGRLIDIALQWTFSGARYSMIINLPSTGKQWEKPEGYHVAVL